MTKRLISLSLLALALAACAAPRSGNDYPQAAPQAQAQPVSYEEALILATKEPQYQAIRELAQVPFGFPLNAQCLDNFQRAGVGSDVLDYLNKRARVDFSDVQAPTTTGPLAASVKRRQEAQNRRVYAYPQYEPVTRWLYKARNPVGHPSGKRYSIYTKPPVRGTLFGDTNGDLLEADQQKKQQER